MTAITFPELDEVRAKISAKQDELGAILNQAGRENGNYDLSKVEGHGTPDQIVDKLRAMNEELDDLGAQRDKLQTVAAAAGNADVDDVEHGAGPISGRPKGLGDLIVGSNAFKARARGGNGPAAEIKATLPQILNADFTRSAGWAPETFRTGTVIESAQRPIEVTDLFPTDPTSQSAVKYMEETTFTNTAAETAEGGTYPEAALQLTERSVTVEKIPVFLPVTDEQLEDEPMARSYINRRLPFMIRQRLDSQLMNGDGSTPNIRGILNATGLQTQAKSTDSIADATYKAMVKVRHTGYGNPNAVVYNPTDWQTVRLSTTTDGVYLWGSPSEAGPARIWGVNAVETSVLAAGVGVVGDFANFVSLAVKRDIDVQISNSHADFFINGKQAIRADIRVANVIYRGSAFCQLTGLNG